MTLIRLGASVRNSNNIELGIVGEQGTCIIGIQPKDLLNLYWGNKHQCSADVPDVINPQEIYPTIICR